VSTLSPVIRRRPGLEPVPTHARWRSVRINPYVYATVMLVLFLGTIQATQALGVWTTSGKVTGGGERIVATGLDPAEIKGWMTVQDVCTAYGVSPDEFIARFALPPDTPLGTPLKDLENAASGFSMEDVRTWLRDQAAVRLAE
jgi:hypothetical protein